MQDHLMNILDNLITSAILGFVSLLTYQARKLKKRIKEDAKARDALSKNLGFLYAIPEMTAQNFSRQDVVPIAETILCMSTRLLSESQCGFVVSFITFTMLAVAWDLNPYHIGRLILWLGSGIPCCMFGYQMLKHSSDLQAYENGILKGQQFYLEMKKQSIEKADQDRKAGEKTADNTRNELPE